MIEVDVTTVEVDRQKAGISAAAGVTEYWLLIPESRCVEVHREPTEEGFRQRTVVSGPVRLESTAIAGLGVALAELFPEPNR
ncbi:MAG: Uma2 family endonuclease [Verrucomicrobiae bacterium]|nr:Uma2 family endonuclease [Verrucomicrobiae bacterium]